MTVQEACEYPRWQHLSDRGESGILFKCMLLYSADLFKYICRNKCIFICIFVCICEYPRWQHLIDRGESGILCDFMYQ